MNEDDVNMITYFWQEKHDVTRWSSWEERKEAIRKSRPELVAAVENLTIAQRTLSALVRDL